MLCTRSQSEGLPAVPAVTDIHALIASVEQTSSAEALKYRIVASRRTTPAQRDTLIADLNAAQRAAPVASRRWYSLESVLAFAQLFGPGDERTAGLTKYTALFEGVSLAEKNKTTDLLDTCISDYVRILLLGHLRPPGDDDDRFDQVLLATARSYVELSRRGEAVGSTPPWQDAFARSGAIDEGTAMVTAALKQMGATHNYHLARLAASVYAFFRIEDAITLLRNARTWIPASDVEEVESLYGQLGGLLASAGRPTDAMTCARQCVDETHRGWARLAGMAERCGDRGILLSAAGGVMESPSSISG